MPKSSWLNASQDVLIPAAAIWRHTQPAVFTVWLQIPPSLLRFHPYLSADENAIHLRQPAFVCVCLCTFVHAQWDACCASEFTASISEKPNESPENCYLPALSCSVLSSLFSHCVFYLLVFSPLTLPSLFVCLNWLCLHQLTSYLYLLWVHILHILISPLTPREVNCPRETVSG